MNIQEYVTQVKADPRYTELDYKQKYTLDNRLMGYIEMFDPDYRAMEREDQRTYRRDFLSDLPNSLKEIEARGARTPQEQVALDLMLKARQAKETGRSGLTFEDGYETGVEKSGTLAARFSNWFTAKINPVLKENNTTYVDILRSPEVQDAQRYAKFVERLYDPKGMTDYKFGHWIARGVSVGTDMAAMATLYGSVGSPGMLTQWVGPVSQAVAQGAGTQAYLKIGLHAATETLGFVGEDLIMDMMEGKFGDDYNWGDWLKQIPGDLARGFAYFTIGEAMGWMVQGGINLPGRVMGHMSEKSAIRYYTKIKGPEYQAAFEKAVRDGDPRAVKFVSEALNSTNPDGRDARRLTNAFRRLDNFRHHSIVYNDLELTKSHYRSEFDMDFDGNRVTRIGDTPVDIKFKTVAELQEGLDTHGFKKLAKRLEMGAKVYADRTGDIRVVANVTGQRVSAKLGLKSLVNTFVPTNKTVNVGRVQDFVSSLKSNAEVVVKKDFFKYTPAPKKGRIVVPETVTTNLQSKRFAASLQNQLVANDIAMGNRKYPVESYIDSLSRTEPWSLDEIKRFDNVRAADPYPDGHVGVVFKDGDVFRGSLQEAGEFAYLKNIDIDELNEHMVRNYGAMIEFDSVVRGKRTLVRGVRLKNASDGYVLDEARNLQQLYERNKIFWPKAPPESVPDVWTLSGDIDVVLKASTGNREALVRNMDKFQAKWDKSVRKGGGVRRATKEGNEIVVQPDKLFYTVTLGDSRFTRDFNSIEDLRKFLAKDMNTYENIQHELFDMVGLEIRSNPTGGFTIFGTGLDNPRYVQDLPEAKAFIAETKASLDKLKPLEGMDDLETKVIIDDALKRWEAEKPLKSEIRQRRVAESMLHGRGLRRFFATYINSHKRVVEKINIPKLSQTTQGVVQGDASWRAAVNPLENMVNARLNRFKQQEIWAMGRMMMDELDEAKWDSLGRKYRVSSFVNQGKDSGKRWNEMKDVMRDMRHQLDTLGPMFGISPEQFMTNYMPRVKEIDIADLRKLDSEDRNFIGKLLNKDKKIPDIDPWYEHARVQDLYAARVQSDLRSIMQLYIRTGYRKMYLSRALNEYGDTVSQLVKDQEITGSMADRMRVFEKSVGGRFASEDQADVFVQKMENNIIAANRMLKRVLQKPGEYTDKELIQKLKPAQARRLERTLNFSVTRGLSTMQTSALMAFKTWMPLRNSVQTFYLGAMYSNPEVVDVLAEVGANSGKLWDEAFSKGYLRGRTQMQKRHFLSFVENVNRVGTHWFLQSDDLTRIVGMRVAQNRFDFEFDRLLKDQKSIKKFLFNIKATAFDQGTQKMIVEHLGAGRIREARTLLERNVIENTMFNYARSQKTKMGHSAIARSMLAYSTYPIQFAEMIARQVKTDPLFAGRLVANLATLSILYNDVMGTQGFEGNPFEIIMFTGGPLMTGAMDAIGRARFSSGLTDGIFDDDSFATFAGKKFKNARTFVEPFFRIYAPMNWVPRRVAQGVAFVDQGEWYASMLSFAGLSVNENALLNNVDQGVDAIWESFKERH